MLLLFPDQRPLCLATALILLCHASESNPSLPLLFPITPPSPFPLLLNPSSHLPPTFIRRLVLPCFHLHHLFPLSPTPFHRPVPPIAHHVTALLVFRAAQCITVDPADLLSLPIITQVLLPSAGPPQVLPPLPQVLHPLPQVLPPLPQVLPPPAGVAVSLFSKLLFLALVFFSLPAACHLLSWLPAIGPPHVGSSQKKPERRPDVATPPCAAQMAGRAGRDKGALRAMMREMAQKTEKRIDSPLVRYNELGQAVCRVCTTVIKSESLWAAHLVSKQHKESTERLKQRAKAAAPPATAAATSAASRPTAAATPAAPGGGRPAAASAAGALPSDFFDSASAAKRPRHDVPSATPAAAASVPANPPAATTLAVRQSSGAPASTPAAPAVCATAPASAASAAPPSTTGLPADFFDAPAPPAPPAPPAAAPAAPSAPAAAAPSSPATPATPAAPASASALPPDFFDGPSTATAAAAAAPSAPPAPAAAAAKGGKGGGGAGKGAVGREGGAGQGVLPEGFFDSKEADHRARGVEYKKPDAEEELRAFERSIKGDMEHIDERQEEEEREAADEREARDQLMQR
ncbi:unnamed protein product, partial [Closterium sp. NIES-53]